MTTAIDPSVLVTLWDREDTQHRPARQTLETAFEKGSLVILGAVHAELRAAPGRTEEFLDQFCEETGIRVLLTLDAGLYRASFPKLVTMTV